MAYMKEDPGATAALATSYISKVPSDMFCSGYCEGASSCGALGGRPWSSCGLAACHRQWHGGLTGWLTAHQVSLGFPNKISSTRLKTAGFEL